jgi:UDPglucose 6-dehydrogenase
MTDASKSVIGFAGMTHLGLNSAVAAAEKGFQVICFDPDPGRVRSLVRGELPIVEPGLPELFTKNSGRMTFSDKSSVLGSCDVVYVAPDVATDDTGASDLGTLSELITLVDAVLSEDAVMVVLSQVPPGFTRGLERAENRRFYQVETLIFGRAMERALYPERFIIGAADPYGPLPAAFRTFLESFNCPVLPMRYESAELAKISINMCLVASVTTANTLAELCEEIGADWSEIVPALRLDRRIGEFAYLNPGLGISGGNLERDLATVVRYGDALGSDVGLVRAFQRNSQYRKLWALRVLHKEVLGRVADPRIAVLGLAYKEDTASTKNSPAVALIENLRPFSVAVYDPIVEVEPGWHPSLDRASTAMEACKGADVLIIMTPWKEFRGIVPEALVEALSGKTVIDPYALLDETRCRALGLSYHRLGSGA